MPRLIATTMAKSYQPGDSMAPEEGATANFSTESAPTTSYSYYQYYDLGPFYTIVCLIFIVILLIAVAGNSLVIFIVLRFRNMRQSVTNFYIMNVALSDVVYILFCAPIMSYQYIGSYWIFGNFVCKSFAILQTATVQVTCTTLTVMTVDRYNVIISPLTSLQTRTIPKAAAISVCVWICSFLVHIPAAIFYSEQKDDGLPYCHIEEGYGRGYLIFVFTSTYAVPLTIIGICYGLILSHLWAISRNGRLNEAAIQTGTKKWKTTKIVLTVILLFAICWFPIHLLNIWQSFQPDESYFYFSKPYIFIQTFSLCLAYSNSCVNPFVYALAGTSFRKHIDTMLPRSRDTKDPYGSYTGTTKYSVHRQDQSRTEPTVTHYYNNTQL